MTLTGKQLFEWWAADFRAVDWVDYGDAGKQKWDALAEKLNGMMAGEDRTPIRTWSDFKREVDEKIPREYHHATCPYRHGKGPCQC